MPRLVCFCEKEYDARQADINRGWSKTCSKRCAAVKREFGRPNARHLDGSVVKWGKKPDYSTRHKKNAAIRRDEEAELDAIIKNN